MLLQDRVALITGGGSGIGRGVALRFAQEGAKLAVVDISLANLKATESLLQEAGADYLCLLGDVSETVSVESFFAETERRFGRLDILVNNAGVSNPPMHLVDMPDDGFDRTVAVNLRGVFLCARAAARWMARQGGRIINMSSQAGKTGLVFLGPYCATKAAVILLTQVLAKELAMFKITVNAVCPGTIDTPLLRAGLQPIMDGVGLGLEDVARRFLPSIPLSRVGYPADVAKLVTFLASDEADYMTGQAINITGGQEMH